MPQDGNTAEWILRWRRRCDDFEAERQRRRELMDEGYGRDQFVDPLPSSRHGQINRGHEAQKRR